jgi:hypothetical protein
VLYAGAILLFSILMAVHVIRTGQPYIWLWAIMILQPFGGLVYLAVVVAPELLGQPKAQRLGESARRTLDPGREYREAKAALAETPTVRNQSRLAAAAAALGRHDEAERLFTEAAHGVHADDPAILLGLANARLALGRPADALAALTHLGQDRTDERTPASTLALGRAYDGVGRVAEAEAALKEAADTLPGFEGQSYYAAFLARHGRGEEARDLIGDMDKRLRTLTPQFRKEARRWRDLAAQALNQS